MAAARTSELRKPQAKDLSSQLAKAVVQTPQKPTPSSETDIQHVIANTIYKQTVLVKGGSDCCSTADHIQMVSLQEDFSS